MIKQLSTYEKGVRYDGSVMIHHSLTEDNHVLSSFEAIKRYHKTHWGWRDIGYNFVIEFVNNKVTVTQGRPLGMSTAHCSSRNKNYTSIGICFVGNFDIGHEILTEEHMKVFKKLMQDLTELLGLDLYYEKHSTYATYKTCPGSGFPFMELVEYVKSREADTFSDVPLKDYGYEAIHHLRDLNIINGYPDNKFHPNDTLTRRDICVIIDRTLEHTKTLL